MPGLARTMFDALLARKVVIHLEDGMGTQYAQGPVSISAWNLELVTSSMFKLQVQVTGSAFQLVTWKILQVPSISSKFGITSSKLPLNAIQLILHFTTFQLVRFNYHFPTWKILPVTWN